MGDTSEDWPTRIKWLNTLIGELWRNRGLYPGMPQVMATLGLEEAIPFWKAQVLAGKEQETRDAIMEFLQGKRKSVPALKLDEKQVKNVHKQWKLREDNEQAVLRDLFPRFELSAGSDCEAVLDAGRHRAHGIHSTLDEIAENPLHPGRGVHGRRPGRPHLLQPD